MGPWGRDAAGDRHTRRAARLPHSARIPPRLITQSRDCEGWGHAHGDEGSPVGMVSVGGGACLGGAGSGDVSAPGPVQRRL
eukprot:13171172-Alexandrium_andersonii.AAC.1